ncbi:uncharacterized protein [Venturia canescens]|nr:uncharacterized protein LOC122409994 [Venturia canescens]XP_043273893.1 uncharacterized protein LOC122409995 [Venturia canescens]XP_043276779.1 uncharacterized protein LOC122411804 isoform X1 [Venturia canescens]XP_043282333.1 uncharacterized protein LOC122414802 [Venturia canescens]XP_043288203.1 uncharacterized protein LOC122418196 isoform X1 [Venturia canescens]
MPTRICVSFDMGWTTRGTGRSYDSLSGNAVLIGLFSKKIIAYIAENRKCKKCDAGHSQQDHDCRKNCAGTAKGMEPKAAVEMTVRNPIFKKNKIQVGLIVADNDSTAIAAIRKSSNHEVVKQCDKNHTSKGVVNELYRLKGKYKELTVDTITYLQRCFSYCISQNQGNIQEMARAIRNIPYHCFNRHTNCGNWCTFKEHPEIYRHANINDGFHDESLFESLRNLFDILASKASSFAAGVSSNANESFNAMHVSKAPKSRVYGMSQSGDMRLACAVLKKNVGEEYVVKLTEKLSLSPGKYTEHYANNETSKAKRRYQSAITPQFKRRRLFLKKQKTMLRHQTESLEGVTYKRNIDLLKPHNARSDSSTIDKESSEVVIFFDLETGGLAKTADILQIAATCGNSSFSVYIQPTQKIDQRASAINGLRIVNEHLEYRGQIIPTLPLSSGMQEFYAFLQKFERKCVLTAHNCEFDSSRLLIAIEKTNMTDEFETVVHGFCDTLAITRRMPGSSARGNKLSELAKYYNIQSNDAHNAAADVAMLEAVIKKLNVSDEILIKSAVTWKKVIEKKDFLRRLPKEMMRLDKIKDCTSLGTRKKMVAAGITLEMIKCAYDENKIFGLINLLGEDENGILRVTKSRKIVQKIYDFLSRT